ncbi:MAG TPA: hypothetical protein VFY05_04965 [Candidatus Angelobacter sp.]|nr:hypothetical protein [Candidatus Angelobacter sp.]
MAVSKNSIRRSRRSPRSLPLKSLRPSQPSRAKRGAPSARNRVPGAVYFDEVRGKTLEDLSVSADSQANLITLTFNDKTEMTLDVEPGISVGAMLESWKTGNSRVLKRWPRVRSAG